MPIVVIRSIDNNACAAHTYYAVGLYCIISKMHAHTCALPYANCLLRCVLPEINPIRRPIS